MELTKEQKAKFIEFMYSYYLIHDSAGWARDLHEFLESVFGEVEF
jgi:hypothetical protein